MHLEQTQFIGIASSHACRNYSGDEKILEIGSYDVNGSIRSFFDVSSGGEYVGVDLVKGPGVDIICPGEKIDYPDGYFDLTISCECFEHTPKWMEIFTNMKRMTKPGGILLFTCASTGRTEHGTRLASPESSPGTQSSYPDYYKNLTSADFRNAILDIDMQFPQYRFYYNPNSKDLYFIGVCKGGEGDLDLHKLDKEILVSMGRVRMPQFAGHGVLNYPRQLGRKIRFLVGKYLLGKYDVKSC